MKEPKLWERRVGSIYDIVATHKVVVEPVHSLENDVRQEMVESVGAELSVC